MSKLIILLCQFIFPQNKKKKIIMSVKLINLIVVLYK